MLLRRHHKQVAQLELPGPSAKKADWVAYAEQEGVPVEGLKRDEIVALFTTEPDGDSGNTEGASEDSTAEASDETGEDSNADDESTEDSETE